MCNLDPSQYAKVLDNVLIFRYLDAKEKESIFKQAEILSASEGEIIIREGEVSPYLFVVLSGCANIQVQRDGKEVFISTIGAGEVVGEAGLFINVKRTANVIASSDTCVLRLKRDAFIKFLSAKPRGGSRMLLVIIYGLLKKLREANQELAFERKSDIDQSDIDDMVTRVMLEEVE